MTTVNDVMSIGHLIGRTMTTSTVYDEVHDPGQLDDVVGRVAVGTPEDVDQAVQLAHRAFESWRHVPAAERAALLVEAADVLADCASELAPLLVREHGGMLWEAQGDFADGTGILRHTASLVETFLTPVQYDDEQCSISIERAPRGVAAAVVPWNMPIVLTMMKVAPALATGNTIVIKPSPFAPIALTLALQRIAQKLPVGVINVVHGNADVGQALTSHPLVRKVAFTGGTATARQVMKSVADSIKNVTLELGGNDPAIVLDDVNIDAALDRMLKGVFNRSGQICFAVKRIYLPRSLFDRFSDAFCERVDHFTVGHGLKENVTFGPLNNKAQFDSVSKLIDSAKNSAATVMQLGKMHDAASNGYYVLPHVVLNSEHTAQISRCEQFGPVIPLIAYDNESQVVGWANDSEYGLGSSVWTTDIDRGLAIARRIDAGSTFVNTHSFESLDPRMPFGGVKQSGIGREFGEFGMREYVEDHAIRVLK